MKTEIVNHIDDCKRLWMQFSPMKTLFDTWEYRYAFWEVYKFELCFIHTESIDGVKKGLLPLWFNPEDKHYYWFGDLGDEANWQENNTFWTDDEDILKNLIKNCPGPARLNSIIPEEYDRFSNIIDFKKGDSKQILSLNQCHSIDDYLASVKKKLRSNLKRDKKKIEELNPEIRIDHFSDFSALVEYNTNRFDDSPFKDKRLVDVFKQIINNGMQENSIYRSRMLTVVIDGRIAGVDLIFICNSVYHSMLCGNDLGRFPGIGNFLTLLDIEDALACKATMIDFAESEEGSYKEKMFISIPQYFCELSA